jgi:nucleotide-binding universal stress UspA family protein
MYERIVVPVDGSKLSECALDHALTIASGCQAKEVTLLMVVEKHEPGPAGYTWGGVISAEQVAQTTQKARARAIEYVTKLAKKFAAAGLPVQSTVLQGSSAEAILEYAQNTRADLIIMSTHGRSGPSRWAMGSTTDRVLRLSPIPVLIATPKGCRIA